jgi:hypothetical protein
MNVTQQNGLRHHGRPRSRLNRKLVVMEQQTFTAFDYTVPWRACLVTTEETAVYDKVRTVVVGGRVREARPTD